MNELNVTETTHSWLMRKSAELLDPACNLPKPERIKQLTEIRNRMQRELNQLLKGTDDEEWKL
jgi:hypothetical protein